MRLFPQDLGPYWHPRLIGRRSFTGGYGDFNPNGSVMTYSEPPLPRMGFWGRIWSRGSGLTEAEAAAALPASGTATTVPLVLCWVLGPLLSVMPLVFGATGIMRVDAAAALECVLLGGSAALGYAWPKAAFRRIHQLPLRQAEVDVLLQHAADPLQREFLELTREAVRAPVPEAEEDRLRAAIRALAAAVQSLPAGRTEPLDTSALRAEAADLQQRAAAEADRVTADSLQRRARAILQRVEANEQSSLLVRRTAALREELHAQIAALREGLAVYQTQSASALPLHALAEAALEVATEAAHVASARAELEGAVAGITPVKSEAPATQTVRVGR